MGLIQEYHFFKGRGNFRVGKILHGILIAGNVHVCMWPRPRPFQVFSAAFLIEKLGGGGVSGDEATCIMVLCVPTLNPYCIV